MANPVLCPRCEAPMKLRKSQHGSFYGCSKYPACKGTRNAEGGTFKTTPEKQYEPIVKLPGSPEQEAIWAAMSRGRYHTVVDAVAGSGKTWTMLQGCLRAPKTTNILFLAFNKHIAQEAQGKIRASGFDNVTAATYHSIGYRVIRGVYPQVKVNEEKLNSILDAVPEDPALHYQWGSVLSMTRKLVSLAKNYLLDFEALNFATELEKVADQQGLELNGIGATAMGMVPGVLRECLRRANAEIDYDDMVWIPVWKNLPIMEKFDVLITDETQDLNSAQQALAFRVCFAGRIIIVGDRRQAIYGFRGAGVTSIADMTEKLGATERGVKCFPLTVTRRCPKSHVALAQAIVPHINAMDNAPVGRIENLTLDKAIEAMRPGDLAVCRVNAPLIPVAYALMRRGVKPVVKGKALGEGLIALVDKLQKQYSGYGGAAVITIAHLSIALDQYRAKEETKLFALGDKGVGRLAALGEKCDCLQEFIGESSSVAELKNKILSLFADFDQEGKPVNAVVLGTAHRTKGLESPRVFVLNPELLPHPMAKKDWEKEQEANLAYVAVTRAAYHLPNEEGTIFFCGPTPAIYAQTLTDSERRIHEGQPTEEAVGSAVGNAPRGGA